jgi:polar amino acid transport system substrate-binding protein
MEMKVILAILLSAFAIVTAQAQVKVGVPTNTAGWSFHDGVTDTDRGIVYDLVNAMKIGQVEFVPLAFARLIPALQEKKIDLIAGNLTITAEREQQVAFSTPFFTGADGLVVSKSDPVEYKTWDDLKGLSVGTFTGSIYVKPLNESGLFSEVKTFASPDDIVREVSEGRIKAAIGPGLSLAYIVSQGAFPNARFVKSYQPRFSSKIALAVRKDDPELLAKANSSLAALQASGEMKTIFTKWGQP